MALRRTVVLLASTCVAVSAAPASAATVVRGKLSGPDARAYSVLGLTSTGAAVRASVGPGGKFRLSFARGAARGATLQLVRSSGSYFGPIVLGKPRRGRVPVGLSGRPVDLGAVKLRSGYAAAVRNTPGATGSARADRSGKPVGAGRLGFTPASARARAAAEGGGPASGGADPDSDGIPTALDLDANGNGKLDQTDPQAGPSSAGLFSDLRTTSLGDVPGTDPASIDAYLRAHLQIAFYLDDKAVDAPVSAVNVDCFDLVYCRRGTGTANAFGMAEGSGDMRPGRWLDYDPDADGLPNVPALKSWDGRPVHAVSIQPAVGSADIHPGDVFDIRYTTAGGVVSRPTVLAGYFVSTPTITSIDGRPIAYPLANGAAGTDANPLQLGSDRVPLTFTRPQRPSIPGAEPDGRREIGGLHYGIPLEAGNRELECGAEHVQPSPTLRAGPPSQDFAAQLWPLVDTAGDGAPGSAGQLAFTLDLGACMRRNGVPSDGRPLRLTLTAAGQSRQGGADRASQTFTVRLPG
jgi:hypothetical protein